MNYHRFGYRYIAIAYRSSVISFLDELLRCTFSACLATVRSFSSRISKVSGSVPFSLYFGAEKHIFELFIIYGLSSSLFNIKCLSSNGLSSSCLSSNVILEMFIINSLSSNSLSSKCLSSRVYRQMSYLRNVYHQ